LSRFILARRLCPPLLEPRYLQANFLTSLSFFWQKELGDKRDISGFGVSQLDVFSPQAILRALLRRLLRIF
jgi:hypothetical protein